MGLDSWLYARELTIYGWDCKQEVDDAKPKGSRQGTRLSKVCVQEDLRRIIGNHVDTAKLLHKHNNLRGHHSVSVTSNRKELLDAITCPDGHGLTLRLQSDMHIEKVSGRLEFVVTQSADGLEGITVSVLGQIPSRALWKERD